MPLRQSLSCHYDSDYHAIKTITIMPLRQSLASN